jgi:hypothetical protein
MVVRGGRIYLRRILDVMKPLRASHHRVIIPNAMHDDLRWWDNFLCAFNGRTLFAPTSQWVNVYVDASLTGGGMAWGKDWSFVDWQADFPTAAKDHINVKETLAIGMAVRRWAPKWVNASVIIHTDNITAKAAINKGKARSKVAMDMVREIFWWSTVYNFKIRAVHIPGKLNVTADAISRLHSQWAFNKLSSFIGVHDRLSLGIWLIYFLTHMTQKALLSIFPQMLRWWKAFGS